MTDHPDADGSFFLELEKIAKGLSLGMTPSSSATLRRLFDRLQDDSRRKDEVALGDEQPQKTQPKTQ